MPTRLRVRFSRTGSDEAAPSPSSLSEPKRAAAGTPPPRRTRVRVVLPEPVQAGPVQVEPAPTAPAQSAPPRPRRTKSRPAADTLPASPATPAEPSVKPTKGIRRAQRIASEVFGYDRLHPAQQEAIGSVLAGHDTLAIMPTGSGKSAIYQVAALALGGPAVVVSPLIALQRDQVQSLEESAPGQAALLNSTLRPAEREATLGAFAQGEVEFLFLAPEQLTQEETLDRLRAAQPALFVVDEAHCVSEWGHDFRPEYLRLGGVVEALGHPTVLALTATAAPPVRAEIVERLGMQDARVLVRGFDRPNIVLGVRQFADAATKRAALLDHVVAAEKPGIVYAATRRAAEDCAGDLLKRGVRAAAYHAGLAVAQREAVQGAFMGDELEVIVATTAFGMGIDKPNVRFVHHLDISGSVDAYYQEIGRAGRDGARAEATLFYTPGDLQLRRFFAGGTLVDADQVGQVLRAVEEQEGGPLDLAELQGETGLTRTKILTAVSRLEEAGALEVAPDGGVTVTEGAQAPELVAQAALAQEHRRSFERSRLDMMRGYAETAACRREYLLNYFGEEYAPPCQGCENCLSGRVHETAGENMPFPMGSRVAHATFGDGLVVRYEGEKITVLFDGQGYQTLALGVVLDGGLLEPLGA